jgi:hypothetical protein
MSNPSADSESIILLVTADEESTGDGKRSIFDKVHERVSSLAEVSVKPEVLEHQMSGFLAMVSRMFQQAEKEVELKSGMRLSEVELSVEIGAKGEVKLVAGGELSGKGAIKLKFTRAESK